MCTGKEKALCQKEALRHKKRRRRGRPTTANQEALCHKEKGDEGTTDTTTANQVATTPRTLRGGGWTGMLDGTSRPTNPEYELDG